MSQIHATAIAIDEQGILLRGPSGSGKSDLALRLIEQGARLVSDDRVELIKKGNEMIAFAPATIKDLFEVRHLGILKLQSLESAPFDWWSTFAPQKNWNVCPSAPIWK